jgi:hypothetical protein
VSRKGAFLFSFLRSAEASRVELRCAVEARKGLRAAKMGTRWQFKRASLAFTTTAARFPLV